MIAPTDGPDDELGGWEPTTVTSSELVDPAPLAAMASLLDDGLPAPAPGEVLPPLWHWLALARWSPSTLLGDDGHARRGGFLPPLDLPRRMFAGGRIEVHGPLRTGTRVRRTSEVESVTPKQGRSGALAVVRVHTSLQDEESGELLLVEDQDLLFREAAAPGAPSERPARDQGETPSLVGAPLTPSETAPGSFAVRTDPAVLMRFSAASANTHRIHYDWPYATGVEGYPGLVVHGPLMTLLLAEAWRLQDGAPALVLEHRNLAPLFCGEPATVRTTEHDAGVRIELVGDADDSVRVRLDVTTTDHAARGESTS